MKLLLFLIGIISIPVASAQVSSSNFSGNLETTFQYLQEDTLIDAQQPAQKGLLNSYMNVFYTQGNFKAGMRVESYLPRIQGYPSTFDGTGIGMRYVGYNNDFIDVTMGSFYEQFGSGIALRIYEDRALGFDNLLDGIKLKLTPFKGLIVKGVYGYQRYAFTNGRIEYSPGIVRGFDGELNLNQALKMLSEKKLNVTLGGSFVSKYQADDVDDLIMPENVGTVAGRMALRYGKFTLDGEYAYKGQDPSQDNGYIFNYGHAAVANFGYSQKGLGIVLSAKSVDNMSYRSDHSKQLQNVLINFLPAMNKTHTYNLVSSLYPYATQPIGEIAYQGEILYTIKKGSKLGGKYGTSINANVSTAFRPVHHTSGINPMDSTGVTYAGRAFDKSDSLYWRDMNVSISRKFNKSFNVILSYYNITLNNDVATVAKAPGLIISNIGVAELGYKFKNKQSMRLELQGLFINDDEDGKPKDKGDWATVLIEYVFNSHFLVSVMDQYNFGNPDKSHRAHHPYLSISYVRESTRLTLGYGRQRAGLFCVGGVCRPVPASNGLTLNFTQSF